MAIIISKNGKDAKRVDKSTFEREEHLQEYIYENPESIPLYDIKENIRLLILAREFSTRSGPIDALGIDKDGGIYLIETKLYRNPDKRLVVAQVLDYGASLWQEHRDFGEFVAVLDSSVHKQFGIGLREKLLQFFGFDEEGVDALLEKVQRNLNDGNYRFVVLMDQLHDRLKDLIIFINENSKFDIFAVELEFYRHDQYEILIPKIFGAEVKKDIAATSSSSRRKWNEATILAEAKRELDVVEYAAFEKIYNFAKANASRINFGTGASPTFSPIFEKLDDMSLFTLGVNKRLHFNFGWLNEKIRDNFKQAMEKIGFRFDENYRETQPTVSSEEWLPKTDQFIGAIKKMLSVT